MTINLFHILAITASVILVVTQGASDADLLKDSKIPEDARLDFTGLAAKYGHPAEEHYIITEDGYNLTLFQLPGNNTKNVLLVHGNMVDPDCFIIRGNISLAITLANMDFNVWLISLRGATYSRRHISLDPDKDAKKFYNFTFYEHGIYDLPETIDYILQETGQTQLQTIGFSLGTAVHYVMGSERPDYNAKVKAHISLAPIAFIRNQKGLTNIPTVLGSPISVLFSLTGVEEVGRRDDPPTSTMRAYCSTGLLSYNVCVEGYLFSTFGYDKAGFEPEFTPIFFGHFPAPTSRKLLLHLSQMYVNDQFGKFDYGSIKNKEVYGSTNPPDFDLGKVTMKVALLVGNEDYLATVKDVQRLNERLPNVVRYQVLSYKNFNHLDFAYALHMNETLYPYVFDLLQKYV